MLLSMNRASVFCEGLDHPECVAVHPEGSVWAGGEAGQIYRISPDGKRLDVVTSTGGFVLGIAFSPAARWLAVCDLRKQCLWRLDPKSGRLSPFARGAGRYRFRIPNHLAFANDGALYVTDSGGFRQVSGKILRFDPDHSGHGQVWHAGPFNFPNGIALAPDGRTIYVVCTWLPGVERITIRPDNSPDKRRVYVRLPRSLPDGLAFDSRGNLYVSCYTPARIWRITPGRKAGVLIEDWEAHTLANPTNIAFGGPDLKDLFVANLGRWHVTRITLGVPGSPLPAQLDLG